MLPDLSLGDDDLATLGEELGGCDFTGPSYRRFLEIGETCDVQAAPGSGKTTALVAKLLVLTRRWRDSNRGICVISHTHAARGEVERRVAAVGAAQLLSYPHYVGTITTFIHRFIALPYLRGLGWRVTAIDDDTFAARATRLAWQHQVLRSQLRGHKQRQVEAWLRGLTLAGSATPERGGPGTMIPVATMSGMPGPHTDTVRALQSIKASLAGEGIYRYADMLVLADRAATACPAWIDALVARFPIVLVDEAQDTNTKQLALIDRLFDGRSCVQKLGDCNQTIYGEDGAACWIPRGDAIDLGDSQRFGPEIAGFASRLTVRRTQTILGRATGGILPVLISYPVGKAQDALATFGQLVAATCDGDDPSAWAVGWVHRPGTSESGVTVCDYHPPYRAPGGRDRATCVHAAFRAAELQARGGCCLHEAVAECVRALAEVLRRQRVAPFDAQARYRDPWRRFEQAEPEVAARLRAVIVDWVTGQARLRSAEWSSVRAVILDALGRLMDFADLKPAARDYLADAEEEADVTEREHSENHLDVVVGSRRVRVRLGSIASIKGETHDATLVLQTTHGKVADVKTALSVAAGIKAPPRADQPVLLKAVTNVFVAATRPRRLLCLALPENDLSEKLRATVSRWGWRLMSTSLDAVGSNEES